MFLLKKIILKKKFLKQLFKFLRCLNIFENHSIRMKYLFSFTLSLLVCLAMGQNIPTEFINREAFSISRESQKSTAFQSIQLSDSQIAQLSNLPQGPVNGAIFNGQISPSSQFQSFKVEGTDIIITVQNTARLERMFKQSQKKNASKK